MGITSQAVQIPKDPMFVDVNQRYGAATQETVSRIQNRDLAVQGFVVLAGTLLTLALTKDGYAFLAVAVGYVALAAALLSCHHDIVIGLLGLYQHTLCKGGAEEINWFSEQYYDRTLKARHLRDWYFGFMIVVAGILGLWISLNGIKKDDPYKVAKYVIWGVSAVCVAAALAYIRYAYRTRAELHELMHKHHENLDQKYVNTIILCGAALTAGFMAGWVLGRH
jgi:hypothetical protein